MEMVEYEKVCSWQVWDEQLTLSSPQHTLTTPRKQLETERATDDKLEVTIGEAEAEESKQPLFDEEYTHVELVNVDLVPKILEQIVDKMVESSVVQSLLVVRLDDNALGKEAASPLCKLLTCATKLRMLSLRNVSMTDSLLSCIIGCCAQIDGKREQPIVIDIRDNGQLTFRAGISLKAGKRFFPENLTIVSDLLPVSVDV